VGTEWQASGRYVMVCNCDYGCPCNFNARPTFGFCQGIVGVHIDRGSFGDIALDGTKVYLSVKWPGAVHEGNGVAAIYLDANETPAQREALLTLVRGGVPAGFNMGLYLGTCSHVLEPRVVDIRTEGEGKDLQVTIGNLARFRFQPIRNPVSKAEVWPRVVLPQGLMTKEFQSFTTTEFWVSDGPELQFNHLGKAAQVGPIEWKGAA
jgi:hypothetical protein